MLLQLAGFASPQTTSNEIDLGEVLPWSIQQVLDVYSPFPAYLLDQQLNILSMNNASKLYLEHFAINLKYFNGKPNLLLSVVGQSSLKPYFCNWHEVVKSMIWRLRNHARRAQDVESFEHLEREAIATEDVREALRLEPNERALHGINNILIGSVAASAEFTHITSSFHAPITKGHSPRFFVESFIPANEKSTLLFERCIADLPKLALNTLS